MELGKIIRDARTAHGWSQQELAFRSGLSISVVGKVERNQGRMPAWITVSRLMTALELKLEDLS